MAETVKKSRIVSEDDLEESLMQEFNMRLKTCMSSDKLNDEEGNHDKTDKIVYENVEIIKSNGRTEINYPTEEIEPINHTKKLNSIEEFIQIERECLRLEQNGFIQKETTVENDEFLGTEADSQVEIVTTDLDMDLDERPEVDAQFDSPVITEIVETLEETEQPQTETKSVKDRMFLSTDSTSCLLFTQTITSPMLTPSEERIDFMKGFQADSTQNTISSDEVNTSPKSEPDEFIEETVFNGGNEINLEIIENSELGAEDTKDKLQESDETKQKEVKPEMQEVEKEEVIEIQIQEEVLAKETQNEEEAFEEEPQNEEIMESDMKNLVEEVMPIKENGEEEKDLVQKSIPFEEESKTHIETVDLLKNVPENGLEEIINPPEIVEMKSRYNPKQKYIESINKETKDPIVSPKVPECKIPSVKSLKDQYIMTASNENVKPTEKNDISTLKSLDIMKQISKFEQISPGKEETNQTNLNTSTETTETTYVETTIETKSSGQEKSLKKKKSKKSRSHEKENISVNDDDIDRNDDAFYNVNVKNLCRSFGDLTKVGLERTPTITKNNKDDVKSRTKSMSDIRAVGSSKPLENVFSGVSVKALRDKFNNPATNCIRKNNIPDSSHRMKSSFSKFDALQKKNVLHVRSTDSSKAQEKFNGNQIDNTVCKSCGKIVFQMEQMKAEKCIWHKNCFRCTECNKQLTVDTYQSHEGTLYCKPHFKALFAPKAVEDDAPPKPRRHEMIIRENQPEELPPDVIRASDKPDLGLEELQSLNVKERFHVFEHHEIDANQLERTSSAVNVKRSPSILSKLARFQAKGMDIGVADDSLNGIPIEESSSEEEEEEQDDLEGEDADLIRAKRAQREKPFHFVGMSDVKSKWEHGEQNGKDERREERKQEIQSIRNRLFMGKQGKMKELYQQAVMESESGANVKRTETIETADTRSLKERFEKGQMQDDTKERIENEDMTVFESGISKKSRSIFLELDANAAKPPQLSPVSPAKTMEVRKAREAFLAKQTSEEVVKSTEAIEDVTVQTADIQQKFKFFETYKEPEKKKKAFRITPPREGQVKVDSPEREVYRDPEVVRAEEIVEDSVVAKQTQTAKKMLNKFRQMEEDLSKDQVPLGPKPLKRFTPPPEPIRSETESEEDVSETEEESEEDELDHSKIPDEDLLEAQKAARAKQLRAKFERWEANEIKREQNMSSVNIAEEFGEEQSQIESTKSLRARFESMREGQRDENNKPRIKVNRFVDTSSTLELCQECKMKVYPLEKISVHGAIYHKKCFKCLECNTVLRMDSYSYNQGFFYCTPHFKRLFITKGNYDTAFGLEQHKEKWNTSMA